MLIPADKTLAAALPAGCPMSIEIPCAADLTSGLSHSQRAQKAVAGVRRALATPFSSTPSSATCRSTVPTTRSTRCARCSS